MTLNAVAYNSLCSEEVRIIESMRRFSKTNGSFCLKSLSDQYVNLIDNPMNKFLLILWKHDPSALDLCKQNDTEVSIFEIGKKAKGPFVVKICLAELFKTFS